jgi:hypothetical protein
VAQEYFLTEVVNSHGVIESLPWQFHLCIVIDLCNNGIVGGEVNLRNPDGLGSVFIGLAVKKLASIKRNSYPAIQRYFLGSGHVCRLSMDRYIVRYSV